jgi:transcriptional antiterminator RfaH
VENASWAVVRSKPWREPLAAQAVDACGLESYFPRLPARHASARGTPLFPGYLFARVAPRSDDLLRIRSAPNVAYLLPRRGNPALLPDVIIQAIRDCERDRSSGSSGHAFRSGDRVMVKSGPFKWVDGLFDRQLSASGRVRILLELVHGTLALQIDAAQLDHAAAPPSPRGRPERRLW